MGVLDASYRQKKKEEKRVMRKFSLKRMKYVSALTPET